eukprot:11163444-Alexandrium_andersonii.AAC.1
MLQTSDSAPLTPKLRKASARELKLGTHVNGAMSKVFDKYYGRDRNAVGAFVTFEHCESACRCLDDFNMGFWR